jgi:C_GCAxxG_C_C family probable redox protein
MKKNRRDFLKIMASSALVASLVPLGIASGEKDRKPGAEEVSKKSRVEEAHSLLGQYGNCCTSVLAAYGPELGMEKDLVVRVTRGMPGIGGLGNVCGAVSGATLVIGLETTNENNIHDTEAQRRTYESVREFVARFEERHSSIECRKLLGRDISTWEKLQAARKDNAFANCPKLVESAVNILDDILSNERTQ